MRGTAIIGALLSVLLPLAAGAAEPSKASIIAVFEIEDATGRLTSAELEQLTTYMSASLTKTKAYEVVPRASMKEALRKEQAESFKACYDEACQIEIGRELAAQKALVTRLIQVGTACAITSTLIDLTKATSERAATAKSDCSVDAIVDGIESIVRDLDPKTGAPPPVAVVPPPPVPPPPPRILPGKWRVTSTPVGANVLIDGREVGKTPLELEEKSPGVRRVQINLDGHQAWEGDANVAGGEETRIHADLVSQADYDAAVEERGGVSGLSTWLGVGAFTGLVAGTVVLALTPSEDSIRSGPYEAYLSSRFDPAAYGAVEDRVQSHNTMTVSGWALIGVGAAAGIGSIITLFARGGAPTGTEVTIDHSPYAGGP